jgi:hypothetical protein
LLLLQGVRQRLNRLEHMKQLSEELSVTEVDPEEEDEEKEWAAVLELQAIRLREEEVRMGTWAERCSLFSHTLN